MWDDMVVKTDQCKGCKLIYAAAAAAAAVLFNRITVTKGDARKL